MIRHKSTAAAPLLLGLFALLCSGTTPFTSAESPSDSDEITNGSLDMRVSAKVDIPKFYVVLSPTEHEFDDDENVIILESTEEMLDWSFQTATEYADGTTFDSLKLLGIKSWFVSDDEEGSRRRKRRSLGRPRTPERGSNDLDEDNEEEDNDVSASSSLPSHTILEIEGGEAEFLVPVNGQVPTTSMVASIIKNAIENDLLDGLKMPTMGGRNPMGGSTQPVADLSSVNTVKYIESVQNIKDAEKDNDSDTYLPKINNVDASTSSEEGATVPKEYPFTTIFVGIAVGGAMTLFVIVALVSKLKKTKPLAEYEFYPEEGDTDSDFGRTDMARADSKSLNFTHITADLEEDVPPSPLNDYISRTSPSPKRLDRKTPVGGPAAIICTVLDDSSSLVSTEDSMECQLSVPSSSASVNGSLDGVTQNLSKTRFGGGGKKKKKKSNLPPLDENTPYSIKDYMEQNPTLSATLSKDTNFEADANWDPNDNDAGSVVDDGSGFDEI